MSAARKTAYSPQHAGLRERASASRKAITRVPRKKPDCCPAAALGNLLDQAWVEHEKWDEQITPDNRAILGFMSDVTLEQIRAREIAISFARASSPAGILTLLAVASDGLDSAANGSNPTLRRSGEEIAQRCLFSIAAALCAITGEKRDAGVVRRYLPTRCDPLSMLDAEGAQ